MMQKKFKVGYVPYSNDLSHPGDRRRLAAWSFSTSNELNLDSPTDSDILILSANANFAYWIERAHQPVVLDLVDGYLGENPSFFKDFGRNILRSCQGKSNFSAITFTRALRIACEKATAVIVASPEQAKEVMPFNARVYVILDEQSEMDLASAIRGTGEIASQANKYVFWEGFGYTIKHFKFISEFLDEFMHKTGYKLLLLTTPSYARWGNSIGKINAEVLFKKWFPKSKDQIQLIPWSIENVIRSAAISDFALIPIDTRDKFANLKPENKLLSMWHLGLPTIFSSTPAYKRVADRIGITKFCIDNSNWGETFEDFDLHLLRESFSKSLEYISVCHSKDLIIDMWQNVIEEVLCNHG